MILIVKHQFVADDDDDDEEESKRWTSSNEEYKKKVPVNRIIKFRRIHEIAKSIMLPFWHLSRFQRRPTTTLHLIEYHCESKRAIV